MGIDRKPTYWTPEMGAERKLHLVFDVETSSLPVTQSASWRDTDNWGRIIQIGWGMYNDFGEPLFGETTFIKPDGWKVSTSRFHQEHGLTTERCEAEGKPFRQVMDRFLNAWGKADVVIGHNLSFDRNHLFAELYRYKLKLPKQLPEYCTKLESTDVLKIPGFKGAYKWPSLKELSQFFFGEDVQGAHDAGNDVAATAKCYFALLAYKEMQDLFG